MLILMLDIEALTLYNPWWAQKKVPKIFLKEHKRPQFDLIKKHLTKKFILLLYGLRQVGKTTLLYQLIQYLLDKGTNPLTIFYFSFDEKTADFKELLKIYQEKILKKKLINVNKVYVIFDEIQKIDDWQTKIKILYDTHPNIKILLSGSASVSLQKQSRESLAGRIIDFFIKPLSFKEFLDWKKINFDLKRPEVYQSVIMPEFMDYLRKGGFPAIIKEKEDEFIRNYLKNTVLERIIYRDLAAEFKLKDIELLRLLLEMIIKDPGMIINIDRLARDLNRTKITIASYLEYLKYALLIKEVRNLRAGFLVSSRKGKKIYPTNPAFCFAYRNDFYKDSILQKIAEVVTADVLEAVYYYRNSMEVDFVLKNKDTVAPVEVKYGKPDCRQIKDFLKKFSCKKGYLVSKEKSSSKIKNIKIIPLWQLSLNPLSIS